MNRIYVISDGTGKTAELAMKAAMKQFPTVDIQYERRPGITTKDQAKQVVNETIKTGGFIIHTLVSDDVRSFLIKQCRINNIESIDIMGPLLSRLSNQFSIDPSENPGLFNHINEEYFRRVETMNFALKHDDGLQVEKINQAEIVLIGVSRTFKTPVSIYLAFKRWFVANVPIVLNVPFNQELYDIRPEKVFCFMTNALSLSKLRKVRNQKLHDGAGFYSDLKHVKRELLYARKLIHKQPKWNVINVTNKSIEEISSEIIAIMKQNRLDKIQKK